MTSAWVVRAGRNGEREDAAFGEGYAIAGWQELDDLSHVATWDELRSLLSRTYPDRRPAVRANWSGQLWRFIHVIQDGDFVVIPNTRQGRIAIGRFTGPYQYREDVPPGFRHVRPVEWLRKDLPREAVRSDLLNSMGSLLTVFGLRRHDAPERIAHLAKHGVDPGVTSGTGGDSIDTREELLAVAADSPTAEPPRLSIHELLDLRGAGRRTEQVVAKIAADLSERGLTTRPPFTDGSVHNTIQIVWVGGEPEPSTSADEKVDAEPLEQPTSEFPPISLRVGNLKPRDSGVASVSVSEPLAKAHTVMLAGDYSQLLVTNMDGGPRGALSWESLGKTLLANQDLTIANATFPASIVAHDEDLLTQIDEIYRKGFIFVRSADQSAVTGIITAADLTREFGSMAKPFAIVEQIERRLRRRVDEVFTLVEIRAVATNPSKTNSAADLMLGAYVKLLKSSASFARLDWPLDHDSFVECLNQVRKTRNELMHFSPDPLKPEQMAAIEGFLNNVAYRRSKAMTPPPRLRFRRTCGSPRQQSPWRRGWSPAATAKAAADLPARFEGRSGRTGQ